MNHQELYKLVQTVQKNVRCPQCGKNYDFSLIQIRGVVDTVVFLELNCPEHMPLLATVSIANKTTKNTDQHDKITNNDVISVYKTLKNFSGSMSELFKENNSKKSVKKE